MAVRDMEKNKAAVVVSPHVPLYLWNLETSTWLIFLGYIEL